MSFDMARDMSGKSIASAIAGDDAAVKPRSFRRDGAGVAGMLIAEKSAAAEEGRDLVAQGRRRSRQYATRSIGIAREAHGPQSRQASRRHCQAVCGRPAFADASLPPVRSESLPNLPIRPSVI
jgi:dihydroxyacetone kinase